MSHELIESANDGRGSMFYVGETPWHELGVGLAQAPTLNEAVKLAAADFHVRTEPLYVKRGSADSVTYELAPGQAISRADTGSVFAVTGERYKPLQNWDAFRVLEPLLERGIAHLETGGTLREGADVWMLARFDVDDPVVREVFANEVVPYALISNNHSARRAARIQETPIRVVCANTLGAAHAAEGGVYVKHTGDGASRMVEAAQEMFRKLTERYVAIAQDYKLMRKTVLSVEAFERSVLDTLAPLPASDAQGFVKQRALDRRITVAGAWEQGAGHVGDHSAWEAYNGAVECLDHDVDTFPVRGDAMLRLASMKDGRIASLKASVLNAVLVECRR